MASSPEPLPAGAVLGDRFEIERLIGRGGFGLAYLARDRSLGDEVVVKELAPEGSVRGADGLLDLEGLGPATAHRLRRCFLDEARLLARLNIPGVVNVRTYGAESGSAYYVTDYCADAEPLDAVLRKEGRLPVEGALDIGYQLIETLDAVHRRRILHRDIKPANVLLRKSGQAVLIDFGAAREWHADMTEHHTVLFTPGFAPPEQLSERARRGPATDVYGVAALMYTLLAGFPPTPATDRLNGVPLQPLALVRPEVDAVVAHAIEAGLSLQYAERPQTAAEFRDLFAEQAEEAPASRLEEVDAKLLALQRLSFGRRQCPSCGDVLHVASPLPLHRCPVCERGTIKARPIHSAVCPVCRLGILHTSPNVAPLAICPICARGVLTRRRLKLLGRDHAYRCPECEAVLAEHIGQVELTEARRRPDLAGTAQTWGAWAELGGRSHEVHICDGCQAQFDTLPDGQWRQVQPEPEIGAPSRLYPEEWARVAAGLDPGCGSHVCTACGADFFVDGERVTLLGATKDPFRFADANMGRPLSWESLRWLGIGKTSERPGPACPNCGTEFDAEGDYLRLVRTDFRPLARHVGTLQTLEDWHRIARGLPRVDEQAELPDQLDDAIFGAYVSGELSFDDRGTLWRGQATRVADGATGTLAITPGELTFGGRLRRDRKPLELLASVTVRADVVSLQFRGSSEPVEFEIEEAEFTAKLRSGDRLVAFDAGDLAERLQAEIAKRATPA